MGEDTGTVRHAQPSDAMGIGFVHVRPWQAAYRGQLPQEYLDGLDPIQRGEAWRQVFEGGYPGDRQATLVVELDAEVVGFANVGPSRDDDANGAGEVPAIYLLSGQWGRGLGRRLMVAALSQLADFGFEQATLWVLDTNERARRFYEAGGWAPDDAFKTDDRRGFSIAEVRHRRQLPEDRSGLLDPSLPRHDWPGAPHFRGRDLWVWKVLGCHQGVVETRSPVLGVGCSAPPAGLAAAS